MKFKIKSKGRTRRLKNRRPQVMHKRKKATKDELRGRKGSS